MLQNVIEGMQKLKGENLKVVWTEFSTLSLAVLVMSVTARYRQTRSHLKLETQLRYCPVSLRLSKVIVILLSFLLKKLKSSVVGLR